MWHSGSPNEKMRWEQGEGEAEAGSSHLGRCSPLLELNPQAESGMAKRDRQPRIISEITSHLRVGRSPIPT